MSSKIIRNMRKTVSRISPVLSNKIMYYALMHKKLNLKHPQTFNEKINWMKLYKFPNDKTVIQCADKYAVREYIKNKGLEDTLNELYYVWDSPDQIDWDALPDSFVIKCNHGCAYNIICRDKSKLDKADAVKKLNKWMKEDFGLVTAEPHYDKIPKKIICEKYLADDLLDYKFFCFNGEPLVYYVSLAVGGDMHNLQADFFTPDGKVADFYRTDHDRFKQLPEMPENLQEMINIAKILSHDFAFVRVDLFSVDNKIYFSELTFTPCSGMMPLAPASKDYELGQMFLCGGE